MSRSAILQCLAFLPYILILGTVILFLRRANRSGSLELERRRLWQSFPKSDVRLQILAGVAGLSGASYFLAKGTKYEWASLLAGFCGSSAVLYDYFVSRPRRFRRLADEVIAKRFKVCPRCMYDLQGSPDDGVCPECGTGYTLKSLETDWSRHLAPWVRHG